MDMALRCYPPPIPTDMPLDEIVRHPEYLQAAPGEFARACANTGQCFNVRRVGWHPASAFPIIAQDAFHAAHLAQQHYEQWGELFKVESVSVLPTSTLFYVDE